MHRRNAYRWPHGFAVSQLVLRLASLLLELATLSLMIYIDVNKFDSPQPPNPLAYAGLGIAIILDLAEVVGLAASRKKSLRLPRLCVIVTEFMILIIFSFS